MHPLGRCPHLSTLPHKYLFVQSFSISALGIIIANPYVSMVTGELASAYYGYYYALHPLCKIRKQAYQ